MSFIELLLLILSVHSLATPILRRAPSFIFDGDAPYTVDSATLAAAVACPNGSPTNSLPAVLLVHGTTSTGDESWGEGYVPVRNTNHALTHVTTVGGSLHSDVNTESYQSRTFNLANAVFCSLSSTGIDHSLSLSTRTFDLHGRGYC